MQRRFRLIGAIAAAAALTACSGSPAPTPAAPSTSDTTGSATASEQTSNSTPSVTGPATLGATLAPVPVSTAAQTGASSAPLPSGAPTGALLTTTPGTTLTLGTANAFHADGWSVTQAQPAGSPAKVEAMTSVINCDSPGSIVEYRFSNATGTIQIDAAQDILSTSATNTLAVTILTDGKAVAEKQITFKQPATVQAPLTGVTLVQIVVKPTGTCTTSSTALITRAMAIG